MSVREPSDYWVEFAETLRDRGFAPVLIGGLAALRYRDKPRLTTDVDFLTLSLDGLAASVEADGYSVRAMTDPSESEPYVIFIRGNGEQVDVMRVQTAFQESAYERAVDGVITAEDVIVFKLLAWRSRDRDDISSIPRLGARLTISGSPRGAPSGGRACRSRDAAPGLPPSFVGAP